MDEPQTQFSSSTGDTEMQTDNAPTSANPTSRSVGRPKHAEDMTPEHRSTIRGMIKALMKHEMGKIFIKIDGLVFPSFHATIKRHMDLTTANKRVADHTSVMSALGDIRLMFSNFLRFFDKDHEYHIAAEEVSSYFESLVRGKFSGEYLSRKEKDLTKKRARSASGVTGGGGSGCGNIDGLDSSGVSMERGDDASIINFSKKAITSLINDMKKSEYAIPFNHPVDLDEAPGYEEIIKEPMDLSTLEKRHKANLYENNTKAFVSDMSLIWNNCLLFHGDNSDMSTWAKNLKIVFDSLYEKTKKRESKASNILGPASITHDSIDVSNPYSLVECEGGITTGLSESGSKRRKPQISKKKVSEKSESGLPIESGSGNGRDGIDAEADVGEENDKRGSSSRGKKRSSGCGAGAGTEALGMSNIVGGQSDQSSKYKLFGRGDFEDLILNLSTDDGKSASVIRARCHKIAKENFDLVRLPMTVKINLTVDEYPVKILNIGELARSGKMLLPAYTGEDFIFPLGFTSKCSLRLYILSADSPSNSALLSPSSHIESNPYICVDLVSMIRGQTKPFDSKPVFTVSCDGIILCEGETPEKAWEKLVDTAQEPDLLFQVLGSRLIRCKAILNRLCACPEAASFMDPPQVHELIKVPMCFREVDYRLKNGVYDDEIGFAWDMRLIFENYQQISNDDPLSASITLLSNLFERLYCDWILSVNSLSLSEFVSITGEWNDWLYLKKMDEENPTDNFCRETKVRADPQQLVTCKYCCDQYLSKTQKLPEAPTTEWICSRCTIAFNFYSSNTDNQGTQTSTPTSNFIHRDDVGCHAFEPAPAIGVGWSTTKKHDKLLTPYYFLSPLGHIVYSEKELAYRKNIEKGYQNKICDLFAQEKRGELEAKVFVTKDGPKVLTMEDSNRIIGGKIKDLKLSSNQRLSWVAVIQQSQNIRLVDLQRDMIPSGGLFGLQNSDVKRWLESLDRLDRSRYIFLDTNLHFSNFKKEIETYMKRFDDPTDFSNIVSQVVAQQRWVHNRERETHCRSFIRPDKVESFHNEEGVCTKMNTGDDGSSGSTSSQRYTSLGFVQLFPAHISPNEANVILALWDFLDVLKPISGDCTFTLNDILRSITPPSIKVPVNLGQIIFDEVCCLLTGVLLNELKTVVKDSNLPSRSLLYRILIELPLNIISWQHIALDLIESLTRSPFDDTDILVSSIRSFAMVRKNADSAIQRSIICLIMNHPAFNQLVTNHPTNPSSFLLSLHNLRQKCCCFNCLDGNSPMKDPEQHLSLSMDEFIIDLKALFSSESEIQCQPLVKELEHWFEGLAVRWNLPYPSLSSSAPPVSPFSPISTCARSFHINPFDFSNEGLDVGDYNRIRNIRMNALDSLESTLKLLGSSDSEYWNKSQRLDVLSTLIDQCAKQHTFVMAARLKSNDLNFLSIADVPISPTEPRNKEFIFVDDKSQQRPNQPCYFTKIATSNDSWAYVPAALLPPEQRHLAIAPNPLDRPIAIYPVLLRLSAAMEKSEVERNIVEKMLPTLEQELVAGNMQSTSTYSNAIRFDRTLPLGHDRYGTQYWLLGVQEVMTIEPWARTAQAEVEPSILIRRPQSGWWGRHNGKLLGELLSNLDANFSCERHLKENLIERLHYFKFKLSNSHILKPRLLQRDWLDRIIALTEYIDCWESKNTGLRTIEEEETMFEVLFARCAEARISVHTYFLYSEEDANKGTSERSKTEYLQRKLLKMKSSLKDDSFNMPHDLSGFCRHDGIARIRELSTTTTATRIHADMNFYGLYQEYMKHSKVREAIDADVSMEGGDCDVHHIPSQNQAVINTTSVASALLLGTVAQSSSMSFAADSNVAMKDVTERGNAEINEEVKGGETMMDIDEDDFDSEKVLMSTENRYVKPVEQLHCETGEVLRIHPSGSFAAIFMCCTQGGISTCCNNKQDEFMGFKWRFYDGPPIDWACLEGKQMPYSEIIEHSTKKSMMRSIDHQRDVLKKAALKRLQDINGKNEDQQQGNIVDRPHRQAAKVAKVASGVLCTSEDDKGKRKNVVSKSATSLFHLSKKGPENHVILSAVKSLPKLTRLKGEFLSILYAIPEHRYNRDYTGSPQIFTPLPAKSGESDMERVRREKKEKLDFDKKKKEEWFSNLLDNLQNAATPEALFLLVSKILSQISPALLQPFKQSYCVPMSVITCAELATLIFTFDQSLRYDDTNLFAERVSNDVNIYPCHFQSYQPFKARVAFTPRCIFVSKCKQFLFHAGKCDLNEKESRTRIPDAAVLYHRPPPRPVALPYTPSVPTSAMSGSSTISSATGTTSARKVGEGVSNFIQANTQKNIQAESKVTTSVIQGNKGTTLNAVTGKGTGTGTGTAAAAAAAGIGVNSGGGMKNLGASGSTTQTQKRRRTDSDDESEDESEDEESDEDTKIIKKDINIEEVIPYVPPESEITETMWI